MMYMKAGTILPLALILCTGCYGAKLLRQPLAVDQTEKRVADLVEQQAKLYAEIAELRETVTRQEEMLRSLRADTQTRLSELTEDVQVVSSRMEDSLERPDTYFPVVKQEPYYPQRLAQIPAADSAQGFTELTPAQAKEIYDNSYLDLSRGNYSLALLGFRDYLNKSPESDLSDNAQYWIGERYYTQRDFLRATEEFERVDRDYPLGDKVPAALLKIGFCRLQLEDRAAAKNVLRDLINRYPTTEEAEQARARLETID
jgi:tol-pal system protein YbgF